MSNKPPIMPAPSHQREVTPVSRCRVCDHRELLTFLRLGPTPAPNGFLEAAQRDDAEKFYPLDVCFCQKCGMVQLAHVVNADVMFRNYFYIPSTSKTMRQHFAALAEAAIRTAPIGKQDLVIDIGSNDGCLLKNFLSAGFNVLGIDPAENLAKKATAEGVETVNALFTHEVAERVAREKGRAALILATNVMAHVPDLHDFLEGVKTLLKSDGRLVAEFPYGVDLIEKTEFDTIYQEHLSYFSLTPFVRLIQQHGFCLLDVERVPVHGGSLRVTVSPHDQTMCPQAKRLMETEQRHGFLNLETYLHFGKKVDTIRHDLMRLLWELKKDGKRIVGYGASAKGSVLLNYCRIGTETLDYLVDSIPYKQGKYTPGMHIPIYPEQKLVDDQPDYALLLAWNFADEIMKKQESYRKKGGRFIVCIPEVKVL